MTHTNKANDGLRLEAQAAKFEDQEDQKGPLMQLTLKGDYAVRVMVDLSSQPRNATVRTEELGHRAGIPHAYLSKIIQALAHAGLVRTQRGTRGGVALLEEPRTITLRQVIEAVEGPIYLNRCLIRPGVCPRDSFCPVHPVWARIQAIVTQELDAVRMRDLADASRTITPTRKREASPC